MPNFRYPHAPASLPAVLGEDDATFTALSSERDRSIEDYVSQLSPTGTIVAYAGALSGLPKGWKLCDGSALSRDQFRNLFLTIGTLWGAGDGTSTFNVPDLRGRTLFGQDAAQTEFATVGQTGGSKTMVAGDMVAHTHGLNGHSHGGATGADSNAHTHSLNGHTHSGNTGSTEPPNHTHNFTTSGMSVQHQHGNAVGTTGAHNHDDTPPQYASRPSGANFFTANSGAYLGNANADHTHAGPTAGVANGIAHTHTIPGDSGQTDVPANTHVHPIPADNGNTTSTGSGTAGGKLPPYAVVRWIIKV